MRSVVAGFFKVLVKKRVCIKIQSIKPGICKFEFHNDIWNEIWSNLMRQLVNFGWCGFLLLSALEGRRFFIFYFCDKNNKNKDVCSLACDERGTFFTSGVKKWHHVLNDLMALAVPPFFLLFLLLLLWPHLSICDLLTITTIISNLPILINALVCSPYQQRFTSAAAKKPPLTTFLIKTPLLDLFIPHRTTHHYHY